MIKNVIFDIGNVLVDFSWKQHMMDLGFSGDCIERLTHYMVQHPLWDELDLGVRHHSEVIADMQALSPQYAKEIDSYFRNLDGLVRLRGGSAAWLSGLKERGYGVYLLSNYPDWMFDVHSQEFDFMPYVDGMVVSSRVKVMKPDEGIYRLLLEKYSLRAEECVFIDDRADNCEAAERLGIRAIRCISAEQARSDLENMLTGE